MPILPHLSRQRLILAGILIVVAVLVAALVLTHGPLSTRATVAGIPLVLGS